MRPVLPTRLAALFPLLTLLSATGTDGGRRPTAGRSATITPQLQSHLVAPGSPAAVAVSSTEIDVTWVDTNTRETGYTVERSLQPTSGFTAAASLPQNAQSFPDVGRTPAT